MAGPTFYDCTECAKNPALKVILGHDGPPSTQLWTENLITGERLERCPLRTLQLAPAREAAEIHRYVDSLYPAYEQGFLLVAGGIADQPARYVELVQLTAHYEKRVQAKYDEITAENGED